ncbi:MAG: pimeloyl-[acyl-carrier protein] methyl ester esterase [Nitrosomonas sp.]|nr:MAG: pimeloyl-[acyl-carrier protein] methyl ester esterase [Nitrosomonas sp.]
MNNKIHVEILGNGPNLVLLHGWAMHSKIWHSVRDQLAKRYCLHLVDLPGHGYSPPCQPGTLQRMVDKVWEILPESCIVCGWSLGGQIAMQLAIRYPERISALVLIATTPCFVKRPDWPWGMETTTLKLFRHNLEQHYEETINRFLTLQLSGSSDSKPVLAQLRKNFIQCGQPDIHMLLAGLEILLTSDLRDEVKQIKQSVLLMHGENDVITPVSAAKWMHQQLQHSKLALFSGCGHVPFLSDPSQFITSLYEL